MDWILIQFDRLTAAAAVRVLAVSERAFMQQLHVFARSFSPESNSNGSSSKYT